MGSAGTKHSSASVAEEVQPTSLDSVDVPLFDSGAYNLRNLTYKVQHLTLLVAGGELPISSKQALWQDFTDLNDALNRLRSLYPEELRAKSKSLLSLFESQVLYANRKACLPRKMSVSVQCDELFGSGIHSDSDGSENSIRASSDSLVGDVAMSSSDRKSDMKYICSECNGTIRVFDNDAFSLSLKLHYEGAAHSQDSGQRSDKEDCRTTSTSSSDSASCSPSEVSVTPGEPVDDCLSVFSAAETKAAVNVCIVKPSHSENSVRLTRCGINADAIPRHVIMWNSVRNRLVELGHVNYIVDHPGLKDFYCSLCKTNITGVQNIMQHVLGNLHSKLYLEESTGKSLCKDGSVLRTGSSCNISSITDKEGKFDQESQNKGFQLDQNRATLKKPNSVREMRNNQPFSDQVTNITPSLDANGSVIYEAWQSMAQELREQGLDVCIQLFNCSLCNVQVTGIQKFIEHVHSSGHKYKNPPPKKSRLHSGNKEVSGIDRGLRSSSSIEEISTLQYKCSPCNLTLTEKDVLAHLAGKKHAVRDSYMKSSLKNNVENNGSLCKSRYDRSKLSQKVVNDNSLREQNGNFLEEDNSPLTLNPYGVEAIRKCDQAAQTISLSCNVVNSSEKTLGVASNKMLEVEKKYYSKKDTFCKTGYNLCRYSSRQYNDVHARKDKMLRSSMPCNYEALKRPAGYWCGICNVMVDDNQSYFHVHQDVEVPCVPQQQVFGSAQYLIMNHSQNWAQ